MPIQPADYIPPPPIAPRKATYPPVWDLGFYVAPWFDSDASGSRYCAGVQFNVYWWETVAPGPMLYAVQSDSWQFRFNDLKKFKTIEDVARHLAKFVAVELTYKDSRREKEGMRRLAKCVLTKENTPHLAAARNSMMIKYPSLTLTDGWSERCG